MTPEQINKAAEELECLWLIHRKTNWPHEYAENGIVNFNGLKKIVEAALSHSRQEIEELKAVIKKQEKEYILNGSVQEWKDYAERTTSIIKNLKDGKTKAEAENEKLREALGDLYHFVERMKISQVAGHAYRNAARKLIEG